MILRIQRRATRTAAAEPVWSSGPLSLAALGHLRAAAESWTWDADDVATTPVTRVYLGCTAGAGRVTVINSRVTLDSPIAIVAKWLNQQKIDTTTLLPIPGSEGEQVAALQAMIARIEAGQGNDAPALLLLYGGLSGQQSGSDRAISLDRAIGIADRINAPLAVKATLARMRWARLAAADDYPGATAALGAALAAFPASAVGNPDWLATALRLLLVLSEPPPQSAAASAVDPAFATLANTLLALPPTLLPADDDLRRLTHALLYWPALRQGDKAAAARHLASAGFLDPPCTLADAIGPVQGNSISDDDFPLAVRKADIAGFTRVQRRVNIDGTTASARTVVARPPLLFDAPTIAAAQRGTQTPPRRAGKPFACDADSGGVRWRLIE